ncbi:MAG: phage tail sheath family protein, partial [Firmicutes bacterium]|nr:phage tail sheath family protein [Bacillota bacterium]
ALQANGAVLADGTEIALGPDQAAYLNGQGIITALNFIGGWKAWGNRTGAYPAVTDPKDAFLPIRRMFDWIANTLVLTFWQKVDYPINRRLIDTVVDSVNIWLNGLAARGFILGGRVEFIQSENPDTDLMDGIVRFHVYVTPPAPAREIDFIVECDLQYLKFLFAA